MSDREIMRIVAHVFQIDPATRKSWMPIGGPSPVPISFVHNTDTNKYRIVAQINDNELIVDSTLLDGMHFTKTSQKFGQWTDTKASTVYGVGFQSEEHLNEFTRYFQEGVDLTQAPATNPTPVPVQAAASPAAPAPAQRRTIEADSGGDSNVNDTMTQLKYENERLKIALGTSSANAKRWEQELQTLKNNNARLKTALQESAANVEEWKTQLTAWKEESTRMKAKVKELEARGAKSDGAAVLEQKLQLVESERDQYKAQLTNSKMRNGPVKDTVVAQSAKLHTMEQTLQQQLKELASVRSSLATLQFD